MKGLIRKARHVLEDPVLRRWLVRRLAGLEKSPGGFVQGRPPYLGENPGPVSGNGGALPPDDFPEGNFSAPEASIQIALPGATVEVSPDNALHLFDRPFDDLETRLAAHRFAWVPVAGTAVDGNWVAALWRCWLDRFGRDETGWPWHAYTAAERAINIIDFSRRCGLPGPRDETGEILARHGDVIRANLEYFGEHYTSNHLSNNGRGLLRIGTALERADFADPGARIMVAEAARIFGRSGVLREGSTHYHQLVTRNYIDAWIDARSAGMSLAETLKEIAARAVAALPGLRLPGGMPLIGDISPDVTPAYLEILGGNGSGAGWPSHLPDDRQQEIRALITASTPVSPDKLADDGWHRFGGHGWQALMFVPPDGWPPMPGHAHEDLGSFELHDGERPVIVDPGRGSYGESEYATAPLHNYLSIDGAGPMAINRPYYADDYRRRVIRQVPTVSRTRTGGILSSSGFSRLRNVGAAVREWCFLDDRVEIFDRIEGTGQHRIQRRFHALADSSPTKTGATLDFTDAVYDVSSDCPPSVENVPGYTAYGRARPGSRIVFDQTATLPFECKTVIRRR